MTSDELLPPGNPVDLTNCDREPIHIPSRIQPHGVLLAFEGPQRTITRVSANCDRLLGVAPGDLLGQPIDSLLEPAEVAALSAAADSPGLDANPLHGFTAPVRGRLFDAIVHRVGPTVVLEMEPVAAGDRPDTYALVRRAVTRVQSAHTVAGLLQAVAEEVRRINGFDRVMVYRFDADGHGSVVAEDRRPEIEPFLGLHYPASDIPQQARRLYTINLLRLIGDVEYAPADLLPASDPPLDMSHCVLRSVSPIHVQYLKNMGVAASMSVSLLQGGNLWGLIACHHYAPRFVPYDVRTACEFLGQVVSLQLAVKQDAADHERTARLRGVQARLIEVMADAESYVEGLAQHPEALQALVDAGGTAVCAGDEQRLLGETPDAAQLARLVEWLARTADPDGLFVTDQLARRFPEAEAYREAASGLLAVAVSKAHGHWILWFRPEQIQTVNWAGDPNKPVETGPDATSRLTPRGSFALWRETVRGRSLPWEPVEIDAALAFRRALVGVILRQAEELAQANAQLARSNEELDSFAYIAAHDLKEPLRGMRNYATFLQEDHGEALGDEGRNQLETLVRLTRRMEDLLDSLLHYSRMKQQRLERRDVDLNLLVGHTLEALQARIAESGVEIRVPRPLPTVLCDEQQVGEVFSNLISNAIKYNDKAQSQVEVGFRDPTDDTPLVLMVRDNGIGIPERHLSAIFRIFKRLHSRDQFGGGTGAGLTIAQKIVERHGGRIWAESVPGEGTAFCFTLTPEADHATR